MQPPIFRQKALDRLSAPEQLDQLLQVTDPRGWITLGGIGILLLALLAWACFGDLPIKADGAGVLARPGGIQQVISLYSGVVMDLELAPGARVQRGQRIGTVMIHGGEERPIISPDAGNVSEVIARPGSLVAPGAVLASLDRSAAPLIATLYVPVTRGEAIRPGMWVYLSPATAREEVYGYVPGRVKFVTEKVLTPETLTARLDDPALVRQLTSQGPVLEVVVEPERQSANPTGLRWSISSGPHLALASGTHCTARIRISSRPPIALLFPGRGR